MFNIRRFINYNINWLFMPIVSGVMLFLPSIFSLIGLSSIGPIAGGLFSTMQGSGIASGSFMAMLQSFAMSGWIASIQLFAKSGWIAVSILTFINKIYFMIKHNRGVKFSDERDI